MTQELYQKYDWAEFQIFFSALRLLSERQCLADDMPFLIKVIGENGECHGFNQSWFKFTGITTEQQASEVCTDIIHPADRERYSNTAKEAANTGSPYECEYRLRRHDGEYRWVFEVASCSGDSDSKALIASAIDVTEYRRAKELERRYQSISEKGSDIMIFVRLDGSIAEVNSAAERAYGYSRSELLSMNVRQLRDPKTKSVISDRVSSHDVKRVIVETMHIRKDGTTFPVEVNTQASLIGEEKVILTMIRDITEHRKLQGFLDLSRFNHTAGGESFKNELRSAMSQAMDCNTLIAVTSVYLDNYDQVNGVMGHHAGNAIISEIGIRIRSHCHNEFAMLKVGGNEFVFFLTGIKCKDEVNSTANCLLEILNNPFLLGDIELKMTVSIGVSVFPGDGQDPESLCRLASIAMYRAKETGGKAVQLYDHNMAAKALERINAENSLRQAFRRSEFLVYYQPQVSLSSGRIVGAEALLRWMHPTRGLVGPNEFIALAEDTNLIVPIGQWVLQTACLQNRLWLDSGFGPLRIAVNISARQFRQANLLDTVVRVLNDTGLAPNSLELEITEFTAVEDVLLTIDLLNQFRSAGINIALDDFGMGYSSLYYLKHFPIDTLKIDRYFVEGMTKKAKDAAIVSAIITLAKNLQIKVVAEGVSSIGQVRMLKERGCDIVQGYFLGKPLPTCEFESLISSYPGIFPTE